MRHVVFLTGLLAAAGPFLVGAQTQSGGDEPDVGPTIGTATLEPSFIEWLRQQRKHKKVDVPPNLPALNSFTTVTTPGSGSSASTATTGTRVILPKRDAQVTAAPPIGTGKPRLGFEEWYSAQTKRTMSVEVARMKSLALSKLPTPLIDTAVPTTAVPTTAVSTTAVPFTTGTGTAVPTTTGSGSGSGSSAETPTAETSSASAAATSAPVKERNTGQGSGLMFFKCRSKKCENLCGGCDRHLKYLSREEQKVHDERVREEKLHEERLREVKLREEELRKEMLRKEAIQKRETLALEAPSKEGGPGGWRGKKCRHKWGPTKPCASTPSGPKKPKRPQEPKTTTTATSASSASSASTTTAASSASSTSTAPAAPDYTPTYILNPYPTMPAAGLGDRKKWDQEGRPGLTLMEDPEVPPRPTEPVVKGRQAEPQLTRAHEFHHILNLPRPILDVPPVPTATRGPSFNPPPYKIRAMENPPSPTDLPKVIYPGVEDRFAPRPPLLTNPLLGPGGYDIPTRGPGSFPVPPVSTATRGPSFNPPPYKIRAMGNPPSPTDLPKVIYPGVEDRFAPRPPLLTNPLLGPGGYDIPTRGPGSFPVPPIIGQNSAEPQE
ncbi:uncharacterized protein LY79DRAFT_508644 [Colletotrichum navitas]|uniref:Uncharacterized protein n=1 Tax=Colletotrichum navitas TaxID=681940 RepID=A0AAD8Q6S5_9PEZI|nr:uncharacterized protein LY79DRAFT_508644 [Colletotrichum navitas]KAK1596941.1 hypothetical protein LY79DRAFT_508644 [Colletotrichum navitas]